MPNEMERDYHLARQKECREMARHAASDSARLAHEALAEQHRRRAEETLPETERA